MKINLYQCEEEESYVEMEFVDLLVHDDFCVTITKDILETLYKDIGKILKK